jgi:hypothetical protein
MANINQATQGVQYATIYPVSQNAREPEMNEWFEERERLRNGMQAGGIGMPVAILFDQAKGDQPDLSSTRAIWRAIYWVLKDMLPHLQTIAGNAKQPEASKIKENANDITASISELQKELKNTTKPDFTAMTTHVNDIAHAFNRLKKELKDTGI